MSLTRSRAIYGIVALALLAQTVFMRYAGEPYPAVAMPFFRTAAGYENGRVTIERWNAVFVTDAGEVHFSPWLLLGEFPDSLHGALTEPMNPNRWEYLTRGGPLARARAVMFPGWVSGQIVTEETEGSFRDWLRQRAAVLVPGQNVSRVEFRWAKHVVILGQIVETVPGPVKVVELRGE